MVNDAFINMWENTYELEGTLPNIFQEWQSILPKESSSPEGGREGRHLKLFDIHKQPSI